MIQFFFCLFNTHNARLRRLCNGHKNLKCEEPLPKTKENKILQLSTNGNKFLNVLSRPQSEAYLQEIFGK